MLDCLTIFCFSLESPQKRSGCCAGKQASKNFSTQQTRSCVNSCAVRLAPRTNFLHPLDFRRMLFFPCLIPSISVCRWHYSCTARMGPADGPVDQFACDPQLRVRGVSGLRVADCSVAPFVVSVSMSMAVYESLGRCCVVDHVFYYLSGRTQANTNASAMMIGDKAAEFIYAEHGLKWRAESNERARL